MVQEYIRPYELSIWTLQDSFVTVLKWSEIENRGQLQNSNIELVDDGTEKLEFSVPLYYYDNGIKIINPLWKNFDNSLIIPHMHKIKLIFNKKEPEERVYEFLVVSIDELHEKDMVTFNVKCEGLPFHELGKLGYKVSLSADIYNNDYDEWANNGYDPDTEPIENIQYWNDKIFKHTDKDGNITWKYNWRYEVQMDWTSYAYSGDRRDDKVYEEGYASSWAIQNDYSLKPSSIEYFREKQRPVDISESNLYNITQTIAETFGVFCRYQYEYDDNYHIIGRKVIYYNNFVQDANGFIDLTYPYSSSSMQRTVDNTETVTKLYVRTDNINSEDDVNIVNIMNVEANKSKEDYLLDFDYMHEVNGITDEQYEAISDYEQMMRICNEGLISAESEITRLANLIIEEKSKVDFYTAAKQEDMDRESEAKELRSRLTDGNNVISLTAGNPYLPILIKDTTVNANNTYYVNISLEGVLENTIHLYRSIDYSKKVGDEGRLVGEIKNFTLEHDKFGNLSALRNIYLSDAASNSNNYLIMLCSYNPSLKYDNIVNTWQRKQEADNAALEEANAKLSEYQIRLYGKDDNGVTGNPNYNYLSSMFINWARTNIPTLQNQKGADAVYSAILSKKELEITKFEKMMGPALREGYWQPEDYNDYGDKFTETFGLNDFRNNIISGTQNGIEFFWDDNAFDGENTLYYEVGVERIPYYHIMVDLSSVMNIVANHLDDLSFIYYDQRLLQFNQEVQDRVTAGTLSQAEANTIIAENERMAIRSFTINSTCQIGYVYNHTTAKYTPVLVLLGDTDLSEEQIAFIKNASSSYRPFLGIAEYTTNENDIIYPNIQHLVNNVSFIEIEKSDGSPNVNKNASGYYTLSYPRIKVPSLALKAVTSELFLASNDENLDMYEDFDVISQLGKTEWEDGYYITIHTRAIAQNGSNQTYIKLNYCLSNASTAIYLDAKQVIKENARPKVSYIVQLNILNKNFTHTAYNYLNHIVHINDHELYFDDVNGYISSLKLNLDKPEEDEVEIKNYKTKFEDLFTTIVAQTEAMKKNEGVLNLAASIIGPDGNLSSTILQDSIVKVDFDLAFNSGKLTISEEEGIWGTSDEGVVAFRGGGIFTATQKDTNGNWRWNTGILPSGINANLITSGQLDTNKIKVYAGDKLRFQLNGEGLFAYKSLTSIDSIPSEYSDNSFKTLDQLQYVRFNEEGLSLVAKKGAYLPKGDGSGYFRVGYNGSNPISNFDEELRRVEIGWDGLILRNWSNNKTLYADADTGDLHITGIITAEAGGNIAGWKINSDSLTGSSGSVGMSPTGTVFWAGDKFSVTSDGTLNATGATIRGAITATSFILDTDATVSGLSTSNISGIDQYALKSDIPTTFEIDGISSNFEWNGNTYKVAITSTSNLLIGANGDGSYSGGIIIAKDATAAAVTINSSVINLDFDNDNYIHMGTGGVEIKGKTIKMEDVNHQMKDIWGRGDIVVMKPDATGNDEWRKTVESIESAMVDRTDWVLIKPYYNTSIPYTTLVSSLSTTGNTVYELQQTNNGDDISLANNAIEYTYDIFCQARGVTQGGSNTVRFKFYLCNDRTALADAEIRENSLQNLNAPYVLVEHINAISVQGTFVQVTLSKTLKENDRINLCMEGNTDIFVRVLDTSGAEFEIIDFKLTCSTPSASSRVPCTVYYYP